MSSVSLMAPNKIKKARKGPVKPSIPKQADFEGFDSDRSANENHDVLEKDETEQWLEKIIFGDEAGFLDALKPQGTSRELARIQSKEVVHGELAGEENLEEVADEDVGHIPYT